MTGRNPSNHIVEIEAKLRKESWTYAKTCWKLFIDQ